jgi:chromosome segregation ATPase
MTIKEVKFEKLFSLERYHNEKIGYTAQINDGENADKTMAELILKVMDVEDCLATYREIVSIQERADSNVENTENCIQQLQDQIKSMKVKIEEITEAVKKGGDVGERLQHACSSRNYKESKQQLESYKTQLKIQKDTATKATQKRAELRERIKQGNFNLEGIDVPKLNRRSFDIY